MRLCEEKWVNFASSEKSKTRNQIWDQILTTKWNSTFLSHEYRIYFQSKTIFQGANFGTVISLPVSGWLCSLEFLDGWPSAFYLFGILGVVWFIFWMLFVYDSPNTHPRISSEERAFISASMGPQVRVIRLLRNCS